MRTVVAVALVVGAASAYQDADATRAAYDIARLADAAYSLGALLWVPISLGITGYLVWTKTASYLDKATIKSLTDSLAARNLTVAEKDGEIARLQGVIKDAEHRAAILHDKVVTLEAKTDITPLQSGFASVVAIVDASQKSLEAAQKSNQEAWSALVSEMRAGLRSVVDGFRESTVDTGAVLKQIVLGHQQIIPILQDIKAHHGRLAGQSDAEGARQDS